MIETVDKILNQDCRLTKEKPIIVGVSGGPDSLCLMESLRQAGYKIIVAYFDHQLRDDSSADGQMVEKIASRLGIKYISDGGDVRKYAQENKLSIEEAARMMRYHFLFKLARENKAQAIAVGHTADDQVETILMHFLRGSGMNGLKGMTYQTIIKTFDEAIPIVRPLLDVWRDETVIFCSVNGLRPHYDSTNDSLNFQRNRIRHLLIPMLETYNPKFREAVSRMAQSLKGDFDVLAEALKNSWESMVLEANDNFITFDANLLADASEGLQRNLVKQAIQTLRPSLEVNFSALDRALQVINAQTLPNNVDLKGGLRLNREADKVFIYTSDAELPFENLPQLQNGKSISVAVGEQITLSDGWKFSAEYWRLPALAMEQAQANDDLFQVWLDAEGLPDQFELRVRRSGDVFSPLGLDGHTQKISDFFVNEKVPQRAREQLPLLCVGDEIVWVPGFRPAHPHRLTDETKTVIYFSFTRPADK